MVLPASSVEQQTAIPCLERSVLTMGRGVGCDTHGCGAPHWAQGSLPEKSWVVLWDREMRSAQHWDGGARFGTSRLPKQQA